MDVRYLTVSGRMYSPPSYPVVSVSSKKATEAYELYVPSHTCPRQYVLNLRFYVIFAF